MQDIFVPQDDQAASYTAWLQAYRYDSLNRLAGITEGALVQPPDCPHGSCSGWGQTYQYDRYGNRTIDQTWTLGFPKTQFSVDANTNRLGVPNGQSGAMTYDNNGNLILDTYTGAGGRNYDAENRMTSAQGGMNNARQYYTYDGDGHRVRRNIDNVETWQVYGIAGELLAEYPANSDPSNPQKEYGYRNGQLLVTAESSANIHWLIADQLGSPRMIFDSTGSLAGVSRHDYLPFGEELFAGTNGRTAALGYTGDDVREKFTHYERDSETALDFAEARYYSSTQGRFTRPDPYNILFEMTAGRNTRERTEILRAYLLEPQNWNRYSYCVNDPLNLFDPSGLVWLTDDNGKNVVWVPDDEYKANPDKFGNYQVANGLVAQYRSSFGDVPGAKDLKEGDWFQFNADGSVSPVSNPITNVYPDTHTSYTFTILAVNVGWIKDSKGDVYPAFSWGPGKTSLNPLLYSYQQTEGDDLGESGLYLTWGASSGLAVNESVNILHPGEGVQREVGWGGPTAGIGLQVVGPRLHFASEPQHPAMPAPPPIRY